MWIYSISFLIIGIIIGLFLSINLNFVLRKIFKIRPKSKSMGVDFYGTNFTCVFTTDKVNEIIYLFVDDVLFKFNYYDFTRFDGKKTYFIDTLKKENYNNFLEDILFTGRTPFANNKNTPPTNKLFSPVKELKNIFEGYKK